MAHVICGVLTAHLPRFRISDNPMVSSETYIEVSGKQRATIRVSDWKVVEGEASEGLIKRAKDVYKAFLIHVNS